MRICDFKPNDIVRITVYDAVSGQAVVRSVREDGLVADWIYSSACYPCQRNDDVSIEITQKDFDMNIIAELELLERTSSDTAVAYLLTEKQQKILKDSYKANEDDLKNLRSFVRKNGCTEDGLSDASESFEQGWNNAMEFVFATLGVSV